jgi:hypothetical protein
MLLLLLVFASGIVAVVNHRFLTPTGLTRSFFVARGFSGDVRRDLAKDIDLAFLRDNPHLPRRLFSVRWSGYWRIPVAGIYDVGVRAAGSAVLNVDGRGVLRCDAANGEATKSQRMFLERGVHALEIEYEAGTRTPSFMLQAAPPGGQAGPLDPSTLFPTAPDSAAVALNARLRNIHRALLISWVVLAILSLAVVFYTRPSIGEVLPWFRWRKTVRRETAERRSASRRVAWPAVVGLVAVWGAGLRLEALIGKYGPLERPAWAYELQVHTQERLAQLHPGDFAWKKIPTPYVGGDPYSYIRLARQMRSFYEPSVREPVFLFTTRIFLGLLDQQDIAVSFASAMFSIVTIVATYLLGSLAFSRWVGLGAALAIAAERVVITWSVDGWRDEAFTFFVVLSAYALLRCRRHPSFGNAVFAGVTGGLACLTRITALSFLLPALAYLIVAPRRRPIRIRLQTAGLALILLAAVIGPFMIGCAIAYGDPLYAINYHTRFYQAREGVPVDTSIGALRYVRMRLADKPGQQVQRAVTGVTRFPFDNKWTGFEYLLPGLGSFLAWSAIAGLGMMMFYPQGRFLEVILLASLLPYAFTWQIPGGAEYRFTLHAYPFYLIAAALAIESAIRVLLGVWRARGHVGLAFLRPEAHERRSVL